MARKPSYHFGEVVYFVAGSQHIEPAGRVIYGEECTVTDPELVKEKLEVRVTRLNQHIECFVNELTTTPPPPLPDGYDLDERAFYMRDAVDPKDGVPGTVWPRVIRRWASPSDRDGGAADHVAKRPRR